MLYPYLIPYYLIIKLTRKISQMMNGWQTIQVNDGGGLKTISNGRRDRVGSLLF